MRSISVACAVALLVPLAARAGFTSSSTLDASSGGRTLRDGTVYTVPANLTLSGNAGASALKVAEGATAVIFIPAGLTLTVNGGDASGRTGAGAGVEVPSNSTLVVTGGGSLVARGGDGANGGNGANGDSAQKDDDDFYAGKGGTGGAGGGGAAAGIGGKGGNGGTGGAGGASRGWEDADDSFDYDGNDGGNGGAGAPGGTMGSVYFLGSVSVTASRGAKGSGGTKGSAGGRKTGKWGYEYICGGGGGGGGGAGGAGATSSIGGGGAGGGAGGGGGSGGYFWTTIWFGDRGHPLGAGGRKGSGADSNDGEGWTDNPHYAEATTNSDKNYGGKGGGGGSAGTNGGNGSCYAANEVSGAPSGASPVSTHSSIEYTLTFSDDWRTNVTRAVKLGYALPASAPVLTRANYTFLGWFDRRDGLGTKYYGVDGARLVSTNSHVGDLTLHAGWQINGGTQASLMVTVDGVDTPIVGGVSTNGPGNCFTYSGDSGILGIYGSGKTYAFSGSETNGEVQIAAYCGCTVEFNGVNIDCSSQADRGPFAVVFLTASEKVRLVVNDASQLKASAGRHAITLITDKDLEITGDGLLKLVGGDAADIAPYYDLSVDAPVALDTRNPDLHFGTGILTNDVGKAAVFTSLQTGERVWRVRVDTGCAPGAAIAWSGLPEAYTPQHSVAGANGEAYLWLPDGTYLFSSLSSAGEHHWVARVAGAHHVAFAYEPTGLLINGTDSGYLSGPGWYFDEDHTVVLTNAGPFVISGTTACGVGVEAAASCAVTFSDLMIDDSEHVDNAAFRVAPGATATITLVGSSVLQSGARRASLEVPAGATAIIDGEGSLTASTGRRTGVLQGGAGIGGAIYESAGRIEIRGGTVTAKTTASGSGIGGGTSGAGGTVIISGGTVDASGRHSGIGGGYQAPGGTTTISDGTVTASSTLGAGIGAGNQGADGGTTMISGGIVTARGGSYGAGIGGASDSSGKGGAGGTTMISGGVVTASGGSGAAGIGGGRYSVAGSTVMISGGTVFPTAGAGASAIGNGVNAGTGTSTTTITGGSVRVTSGALVPTPVNAGSTPLRLVTCGGFAAGSRVELREYSAIPIRYGGNDLYADDEGKVYLWLPEGTHRFFLNGETWIAYPYGGVMYAAPFFTLVTVDGIDISEGSGPGWEYDGLVVTLYPTNAAPLVVSGTREDGIVSFKVVEGGEVVVSNLVIDVSSRDYTPAFDITASGANGTVTLRLAGESAFTSGRGAAGVECSPSMKLVIDGEGSLVAQGGNYAAGIGGYSSGTAGTISIRGGVVEARGGSGAAGIGGGRYGNGGTIRISGGTVAAKAGGTDAQDVGAGDVNSAGTIEVTGGSLRASTNSFHPFLRDANGELVWRVEVGGLTPNERVTGIAAESVGSWPPSYGTNCIRADANGKIYLWLPNGDYDFFVTSVAEGGEGAQPEETTREYSVHVADENAEAQLFNRVGLLVNGRDIGHAGGPGWYFDSAFAVHLTGAADYVLSGRSIETGRVGRIGFDVEANARVTLSNLVLNLDYEHFFGATDTYGRIKSAISVADNATVAFTLAGTNVIVGGLGAGIHVPEHATATFDGGGFLEVTGGNYGNSDTYAGCESSGAGIGGVEGETSGWIEIALDDGGEIVANGGYDAAGIGGGGHGDNGTVVIRSGTVTASGAVAGGIQSSGGAGIGGGYSGSEESRGHGGTIKILGGVVTAIGGGETYNGSYYNGGAGIGGGYYGEGGTITISNATVVARGFRRAAGIGGGENGAAGDIRIEGGDVTAFGEESGPGIGTGSNGGNGGSFTMAGGVVRATGGDFGAGIGGGYATDGISVQISGGIVYATGGNRGAGIGGGGYASGGTTVITGGTVFPKAGAAGYDYYGQSRPPSAIGPGDYTGLADTPTLYRNQFEGGAIYTEANLVSFAATNQHDFAVFPVDFNIGLPTNRVASLEMLLQASPGPTLYRSFTEYGANGLYTDENGVLRLWLPATVPTIFTAKITMSDGSVHYFVFSIDENGRVGQVDYLVVNGEFVTDQSDASGNGWTYTKDTGIVLLTGDATVEGISTNGAHRLSVPRGGASRVTFEGVNLRARNENYAAAMAVSNVCTLVLANARTNFLVTIGQYAAGLEVCSNATLTIMGATSSSRAMSGILLAKGGRFGAGIGSRGGLGVPGKIVIESGAIVALGGEKAAGIGGGISSILTSDNIVITGGIVDATGGQKAAGIGSGYVGGVSMDRTIPPGAVRISGGTVLATRGSEAGNVGDFIASGNTVSTSGDGSDTSFVITGGNVHGANLDAKPIPVDAAGRSLRYVFITGLVPGAEPIFEGGLPDDYGLNDVVVDSTGSICLWLPSTNGVRTVALNGEAFSGGSSTNNAFSVGDGGEWPETSGEEEGEETRWRVAVRGLPPVSGIVSVGGLEAFGVTQVVATAAGTATFYLPSAAETYDFSVGGRPFHVHVADASAVAWFETGVTVDGVDLGTNAETDGWHYDGATGILSLTATNAIYGLAGTNAIWDVAVRAEAPGVAVRADRLFLSDSAGDSFSAKSGANLTLVGGTVRAGATAEAVMILGGSLDVPFSAAVSGAGVALHRVVLPGFEPGQAVPAGAWTGIPDDYDVAGLFADDAGSLHLWLPDGDYEISNGELTYVATVAGADVVASLFRHTGVLVNGIDAGRPFGPLWTNECGVVRLYNERRWNAEGDPPIDYVITGDNTGAPVSFVVDIRAQIYVTLDNLVLTNAAMTASPLAVTGHGIPLFRLAGTNILVSAVDDLPAVRVSGGAAFSVHTNGVHGVLSAIGAGAAPAIGPAPGENPGEVVFVGGTIVAAGGPTAPYDIVSGGYASNLRIYGASVHLAGCGAAMPQPAHSYSGEPPLWCVELPGFAPGAPVDESVYSAWYLVGSDFNPGSGWVADESGAIYLWLEDGEYDLPHDGVAWHARVNGADTIATTALEGLAITSVTVDGGSVALVVRATPDGSLTAETAALLRVRAWDSLPLPAAATSDGLLDTADVTTTFDPLTRTATLVVPTSGSAACFYRVELP